MAGGDKIKKSDASVYNKPQDFFGPSWQEYIQSGYEISNNHQKLALDSSKLKNQLKSDDNANAVAFDEAMKKIKQEMIASDESSDNSLIYAAMAKFKKTNE